MPMEKPEQFGTENDGSPNREYCCYCYGNGALLWNGTMEEMVEACTPHVREHFGGDEAARAHLMSIYPTLKRWAK